MLFLSRKNLGLNAYQPPVSTNKIKKKKSFTKKLHSIAMETHGNPTNRVHIGNNM